MKIPRFIKLIMAFLVCIALIRAVNRAGPLSLIDLLTDLQSFEFDLNPFIELLSMFKDGTLSDILYQWDHTLTGIDGFFYNFGLSISSFFLMLGTLLRVVVVSLWSLLVNVVQLIVQLFTLLCKLLGFSLPSIA